MHDAAQESTNCQNDSFGMEGQTTGCHDPLHATLFNEQVVNRLLEQAKVRLLLNESPNSAFVQCTIRLSARGPDSRTFPSIQYTKMDTCSICSQRHRATQCINLFDKMALSNAANGRIAGHLSHCLYILGQQQRGRTSPTGRQCGLSTRMATPDNDDIKIHRNDLP